MNTEKFYKPTKQNHYQLKRLPEMEIAATVKWGNWLTQSPQNNYKPRKAKQSVLWKSTEGKQPSEKCLCLQNSWTSGKDSGNLWHSGLGLLLPSPGAPPLPLLGRHGGSARVEQGVEIISCSFPGEERAHSIWSSRRCPRSVVVAVTIQRLVKREGQ